MKKKICIITGSRAEYGLLFWLIKEASVDSSLELQLVVTGSHLSHEYGYTLNQIISDGFTPDAVIDISATGTTQLSTLHSLSVAIEKISASLSTLKPELIIMLGDRYEIFAAAISAHFLNIPIAHIHGGELSGGAIDDALRHSITKMSDFHFTAAEGYRKRVIQLGEDPDRVLNVGAMVNDSIINSTFLSKEELSTTLSIQLNFPLFLITYHPTTLKPDSITYECNEVLSAIDTIKDGTLVFTAAGADTGGQLINEMIVNYVNRKKNNSYFYHSLGSRIYLSLMKLSSLVIGNSSSGVIEAPLLKIPSVNIGDRQKGRIMPSSVIQCSNDKESIVRAIAQAQAEQHLELTKRVDSPYSSSSNSPAKAILAIVKTLVLEKTIKKFHDIPV